MDRIDTYRWHIEDPIPFDESFRLRIEHGGTNDMSGVVYSYVAYWYQTHPHTSFPPLPQNLLPLSQARPGSRPKGSVRPRVQWVGRCGRRTCPISEIEVEPGDRLT